LLGLLFFIHDDGSNVPPKRWLTFTRLHSIIFQKIELFFKNQEFLKKVSKPHLFSNASQDRQLESGIWKTVHFGIHSAHIFLCRLTHDLFNIPHPSITEMYLNKYHDIKTYGRMEV
jgi:hypothetical protein